MRLPWLRHAAALAAAGRSGGRSSGLMCAWSRP